MSDDGKYTVSCAGCDRPTQIDDYVKGLVIDLNKVLDARGEPRLTRDEVALCDECGIKWRQFQIAKAMDKSNV